MVATGLEQGGGAQRRNKSPSRAFVSPRLPADGYCVRGEPPSWRVDTGLEQKDKQRQGITMTVVSCLLRYISLFFHREVWYTQLSKSEFRGGMKYG